MPLKSLELVGYKTFASKSTFLFADSITAVVGPNGSGKSNIADSLRWVFGEQSYSLLRGKKTADMIFSGSQERSPAGMASATVTFDNADGWLPIDFSEVSITRRAYRDGQNEYLINNQKVRLRDVSELLGHSGLSERTYTIIGQGLVDAALSLKAEERRRLFEEAAGIGVYRARRADALRRLDLTRRNLERAGDILSELRPRLRSLDRQARRVEEFEQIQADLHVLLRDWYGFHWHNGQADLGEARETARGREKELNEVRSRQSVSDKQILELRERIHAHRSRLSGWQAELSNLRGQRERISRELAVAGERSRALEERGQSADADRAALDEEIRLQEERLTRTIFESEQLQGTAREMRLGLDEITKAFAGQTEEKERVRKTLNEAMRALNDTETRIAGRAARLDALRSRLRGLADNRAALERDIEAIRSEIEDNRVKAASIQEQSATAEQNLQQAASTAAEHAQEQRILAEKLEAWRGATAEKAAEAARMAARLEVLIQAEEAGTGLSEGARSVLDAGRDGRLTGVRGTLGRLLEAVAGESAALAAALGAYYDAVFVETTGDALTALDLLVAADAGGTVVPIVQQVPSNRPPAPEGSLGSIADLIRCPEDLRPAAERLFGNIYVAKTRSDAEQIVKGLARGSRVVTRDGILFSPEGPVTFAGSGLKGLVGRPQQIEGIEAALAAIRTEIESRDETEHSLAAGLDELRARDAAVRAQLEEAQIAAGASREAVNEAESWTGQAEVRLAWQETRRVTVQTEIDDAEEQVTDLQTELAELSSRAETIRAEVDRSGRALDDVPLEDIQEQAAHWQTRAAVSQRAAEDALARVEDRMQAVSDLRRRREDLEKQISSLTDQEEMLRRDSALLDQEERQVEEQIDKFKELIGPVEEELRKLENQQDAAQEYEAGARHSLSAAERNHSQAQITLARRQEHLENLRERIEDDFGLVSFEYDENISGPNPLPLGTFVESLPKVIAISPELGDAIKRQRAQLRRMGAINPDAKKEFDEVRDRFEFMAAQMDDLNKAEHDILETVGELDLLMEREFRKTFDEVAREFRETFTRLFGGGSARLVLTDPADLTETGVDIEAQLPGRRLQGLSLLSGGERSLTAVALVLSLIKVSPTPFCVLDEVDAMLDEANVNRLSDLLRELSERTQFIVITHNRNTVQAAETIYGITMGRDSTSQVLSLKLDDVMEIV